MTAHCTIVQKNVEVLHDSIGQKKHSQLGLCVRVNVESGGGGTVVLSLGLRSAS